TAMLRSGGALEVDLTSRTDLLRTPVREGFIVPDMAVPPYFAPNTIHHGPETFLELSARVYIGSTGSFRGGLPFARGAPAGAPPAFSSPPGADRRPGGVRPREPPPRARAPAP